MQFYYKTLAECSQANGIVVVIDVIRAFTTAACAFGAGALDITLVSEVAEARALQKELPGAWLMGEVGGLPIAGFDLGNSPVEVLEHDLSGKRLIQRTSSGTQGVARARHAALMLTSSMVCAGATARYLARLNPDRVTFIITGAASDGAGDEDLACAEYLSALLRRENPQPEPYLRRVSDSLEAEKTRLSAATAAGDLEICVDLDRYPFAMLVTREADRQTLRPVNV